jgi:sugar-specific transcriptional regulator TrmB
MKQYMTAAEVADVVGVSLGKAYQLIRDMNKELKEGGYLTVSGKIPTAYFKKKYYGFEQAAGE